MCYKIGYAITGSFCTIDKALIALTELVKCGYQITPILSFAASSTDTRFGSAKELHKRLYEITGKTAIDTIEGAEPIGPKKYFDLLVVAPATGNTLGKIAAGITDTPVTMAVKSQIRNTRPVVLAISTNDGLGASARSIGELMNRRNFYFVPYGQDDFTGKPRSLVAHFELLPDTVKAAFEGVQHQPMLL